LPESKRKFLARKRDRNDGRLISFGVPTVGNDVTATGVEKLQQALPNCEIYP